MTAVRCWSTIPIWWRWARLPIWFRCGRKPLHCPPWVGKPTTHAEYGACGVGFSLWVSGKEITSGSVAFLLAPRMNAAGRLGHVEKAVELLLCEEEEKAAALAEEICGYNKERQALEAAILKKKSLC